MKGQALFCSDTEITVEPAEVFEDSTEPNPGAENPVMLAFSVPPLWLTNRPTP